MLQRVISRFSVEKLLSHGTETFRKGTLVCCFRKILVAKKFMDKNEGEVSRFSFEKFLYHSDEKNFAGEPFTVSLISGLEKFYA